MQTLWSQALKVDDACLHELPPKERLVAHRNKESFFTKKFSDIKFVYSEQYPNKTAAAEREKQIKGWGRAKKQMLLDGKLGYNTCTGLTEALRKL